MNVQREKLSILQKYLVMNVGSISKLDMYCNVILMDIITFDLQGNDDPMNDCRP